MPASKEMTAKNITKLGIIAGGGDLPLTLVRSCHAQRIETFVVGFDGQTDEGLFDISVGKKSEAWTSR
jgi:DUF1009 family protein